MSSSSTTACSRSPSPATPATPESSDTLEPVATQEDLVPWLHSLSPNDFLIGNESPFVEHTKQSEGHPLELEDIIQEDVMAESSQSGAESPSAYLSRRSPSNVPSMGIDVADLIVTPHTSISSTKPVPPPLAQIRPESTSGSQCVVYPPKETCYNLPIMIPSIPEGGTKSRVETQVRLTVDLAHASASSGEPLRYDRVGSWKWLRLPKGTSTKRRSRKEAKIDAPSEDTLHLTTEVTCASPPHTRVTCCSSCQGREAKRVARKLAARVRPARSDNEGLDDAIIIPGRGKHEDNSNLVQYNCPEVLDFSSGSVILPLRITCYCRHHREKVGFNVHFTMWDHTGRVVGSGMTRPIMITDDHKSTGVSKVASGSQTPASVLDSPRGDDESVNGTVKRKNARDGNTERAKKRTKPYDGTNRKVRKRDSISSLQSIPSAVQSTSATRAPTRASTPAEALALQRSSPLHSVKPEQFSPENVDQASAEVAAVLLSNGFDLSMPPLPQDVVQAMDDIIMPDVSQLAMGPSVLSMEEFTNPSFLNSDPSLTLPNPNTLSPISGPNISYMLFNNDPQPPITNLPLPKIHRLIPSSGPTYGGIEVTVLGANFHPAMQLNCVFGDTPSSSTQRWSDNTLVCLLPASANAGVVPVWFDGVTKEEDGSSPCLFTYTDETDRALMELALQVVGMKMTGKIEDARNVAMRIVTGPSPDNNQGTMNPNGAMQLSNSSNSSFDIRQLLLARASDSGDFQKLILDFLGLMDVDISTSSTASLEACISLTTASGQTLLHLATILNFSQVVAFLLSHEVDIDARDKNGFTALHFAASMRNTECARLLLEARADTEIVNALGKTSAEIAPAEFFDNLYPDSSSAWSMDDSMEEEAGWADEEISSDDQNVKQPLARRRPERGNSYRKERISRRSSEAELKKVEPEPPLPPSSDIKKAAEAGIVDDKQAIASWMDMVQRTFAQLQHPQGMISQIPALPLPQFPHIPGMPAWGTLPQMPAVFPVIVPMTNLPIPASWALWGARPDQHQGGKNADGEEDPQRQEQQQQPWLSLGSAQEFRAMWEKWLAMARPSGEVDAPPAYTPRDTELVPEKSAEAATPAPVPQPSASVERAGRRVEYEDVAVPDQVVKAYEFRPAKKQARRTHKKQDCMLFFFWIPILFVGFMWAVLTVMRIVYQTMRAVNVNNAVRV
ncbi:hypothetical protein QCA50_011530 [Cerrena zonata]|uniref:IPT/TIG domain-containing protein n=1 Tax=Cerrena zonata TaxID=2478898 RepID=A0AAW0G678_9APHY